MTKRQKYAYNCFTKEQIDCEPKNMVRLLAQANIDSLIARYGDNAEILKAMCKIVLIFYLTQPMALA